MSTSEVPSDFDVQAVMPFCYRLKKSLVEAHKMFIKAYGEYALGIDECINQYKIIHLTEEENHAKKSAFLKLPDLLDQDLAQSEQRLSEQLNVSIDTVFDCFKIMGIFENSGKWVQAMNERKQEHRRFICEELIERKAKQSFHHRIVTGGERWMYIENSRGIKRQKLSDDLNEPSTSTANNFTRILFCMWWDAKGLIRYELLRPGETVDIARYQQQMIDLNQALKLKRANEFNESSRVILLHDNTPVHTSEEVTETISQLGWEILKYPACSPDLYPTYYYLFSGSKFFLKKKRFFSRDEILQWVIKEFDRTGDLRSYWGIDSFPNTWTECVSNNGDYVDWSVIERPENQTT